MASPALLLERTGFLGQYPIFVPSPHLGFFLLSTTTLSLSLFLLLYTFRRRLCSGIYVNEGARAESFHPFVRDPQLIYLPLMGRVYISNFRVDSDIPFPLKKMRRKEQQPSHTPPREMCGHSGPCCAAAAPLSCLQVLLLIQGAVHTVAVH